MSGPRERLAAIDVGSNTVLLTVAEYDPDVGLLVIEESEAQPRLGGSLSATGRLSEEAMQRAIATLIRMRDTCRTHRVQRIAAVATAAVREAENGTEFVTRVRALDIPLLVISPEIEADLAYRSAAHHFPAAGSLLVADIGGGSLELVGATDGSVKLRRSLPLGAVRLTERLLPLPELQEQIRRELETALPVPEWSGSSVIGSGGTFTTLASMALARRGSATGSVHGVRVTLAEVKALVRWLASLAPRQRREVSGLRPERADIIVAGLAVASQLLERIRAEGVTVSGFGLRDGLLLEMVGAV